MRAPISRQNQAHRTGNTTGPPGTTSPATATVAENKERYPQRLGNHIPKVEKTPSPKRRHTMQPSKNAPKMHNQPPSIYFKPLPQTNSNPISLKRTKFLLMVTLITAAAPTPHLLHSHSYQSPRRPHPPHSYSRCPSNPSTAPPTSH